MSRTGDDVRINYYAAETALRTIAEKNQLLSDGLIELKNKLNEISNNWESNGGDKSEFYTLLSKNISWMETLSQSISKFRIEVIDYLEKTKASSSSGM